LACVALGAAAAFATAPYSRLLNALPRNALAGGVLSTVAWLWAACALWHMGLDVLEPYKKYIPFLTLVCIPLTWFWLDNLLSCRAIGGLLCLFPYELLHAARVHPSPWRLAVVIFAYVCIVKGMTLLLYPWKMRQAIVWLTARPALFRFAGGLHILLGLAFIGLGAAVLR
jgi:uncharacterized protein YjeT (DUF2065 family)